MSRSWTEHDIAALLDDAIEDPAEAARLRRVIDEDPDAAKAAAAITELNAALREAHTPPAAAPAELEAALDALGHRLAAATDARPQPRRQDRRRLSWRRALAASRSIAAPRTVGGAMLAAGVALAVGLGWFGLSDPGTAPSTFRLGDAPVDSRLHAALERQPTGVATADGLRALFTFRDGRGRFCREFEAAGADATRIGLACRTEAGRWRVEIVGVVAPPAAEPGAVYALSSGPTRQAMEALLNKIEAGPALSANEEAELRAREWRPAD